MVVGTHGRRVPHAEVLVVGGARPADGVGRLGDVQPVVPGVGVPGGRRARVQVGAPGRRVGALRGERRRPDDGAGRPRDPALVVPVPRRPEPGGLHRRRLPALGGHRRRRLDPEARHAVLLRAVVVARALLVGARMPPLKREKLFRQKVWTPSSWCWSIRN